MCVCLCICTALVILDLAEDANMHKIHMIKTKVTQQLILVFIMGVLCTVCVCVGELKVSAGEYVFRWMWACLLRFGYSGCCQCKSEIILL